MSESLLVWIQSFSLPVQVLIYFSNFLLLALVTWTLFILLRIEQGQHGNSGFTNSIGPEEQKMVKVTCPFSLSLGQENGFLDDGLVAELSNLCPCHIVFLWGPRIDPLHKLINEEGTELRRADFSSSEYDLDCLHSEQQYRDAGKHSLCIPCPESVTAETLGDRRPRSRYPLVVLTFVTEQLNNPVQEDPNSIIGLISIIHLKDAAVTDDSQIKMQYVKTASFPLYSLQPLFMPRDNQSEATSASNKSSPHNQQTDIGESQSGTADSEISKHTVCPPELESRADNHQNIRTEGSAFHQYCINVLES